MSGRPPAAPRYLCTGGGARSQNPAWPRGGTHSLRASSSQCADVPCRAGGTWPLPHLGCTTGDSVLTLMPTWGPRGRGGDGWRGGVQRCRITLQRVGCGREGKCRTSPDGAGLLPALQVRLPRETAICRPELTGTAPGPVKGARPQSFGPPAGPLKCTHGRKLAPQMSGAQAGASTSTIKLARCCRCRGLATGK